MCVCVFCCCCCCCLSFSFLFQQKVVSCALGLCGTSQEVGSQFLARKTQQDRWFQRASWTPRRQLAREQLDLFSLFAEGNGSQDRPNTAQSAPGQLRNRAILELNRVNPVCLFGRSGRKVVTHCRPAAIERLWFLFPIQ